MTFGDPLIRLVRSVGNQQVRQPRRAPRLPVKTTALMRHSEKEPPVQVMLKNISVGGASMTSHVRLRMHDRVTLSLKLASDFHLELRARVVHAGEKGRDFRCQYGLKFTGVGEEDYRRLATFIHDSRNGWQFDAPPPPWSPDAA